MKKVNRVRKHQKVRERVRGSSQRPRLSVFRSSQHIYAQIVDDSMGETLLAESDLKLNGKKGDKAYQVGEKLAENALKKKIKEVVFDRGGFLYHGRMAQLAKGAREGGLKF